MRKSEINRKFDEIVAFSGVEKFLDTPVKRYSSGMRVRLAFSVAAHLEPDVLIIDEVLAVGDAAFQKKCLGKMNEVARQGRTVIFVSHNMAAVENLCSRSILIDEGRVLQIGDTSDVIDAYLKTVSELTRIPLAKREDRKGEGDIVIEEVALLDYQDKPIDYAVSGADLKIHMHYRCKTDQPVPNCRFSATIRRKERIYSMLSTELVSRSQIDVQGEGIIEFVVPKFPLTESVYYITVFIESNKVIQDWVMDAVELNVIDGDYYGTGRNYPSKQFKGEYTLMDFDWNHYPVAEIAPVPPAAVPLRGS
jgi:lipopolysaccharide transport system ATP-binding protein